MTQEMLQIVEKETEIRSKNFSQMENCMHTEVSEQQNGADPDQTEEVVTVQTERNQGNRIEQA